MKKTTHATIRAAEPLSLRKGALVARGIHPVTVCTVCGEPSEFLGVWREHDERDRPIDSMTAVIFLGADHPLCKVALDEHPRLYAEETGEPGHFPRLCGGCIHRNGWRCAHPDLKANGGAGLRVDLSDPFRGAILCGAGGRIRSTRHAVRCKGQRLKEEP